MNTSRKYLETHPWLTFRLDLNHKAYRLWLLLGDCQAKIEQIAGVPLSPELNRTLHLLYLAKGVQATTAIEGNTLSEEQVREAIAGELAMPPSQEYLAQEVKNVIDACNELADSLLHKNKDVKITPEGLKEFNTWIRRKLPKKPDCDCKSGAVSQHSVVVGRYRGAPREDCEYLLGRLCDWLRGSDFQTDQLEPVVLAIVKAIVAHLYLVWIHPFCDGNGRTSRLLELLILMESGIPSPAAHLLSNHYNATRDQYYDQLAKTSLSGGNIVPFLEYAIEGLRDQLAEQLKWVRQQQMNISWLWYIGKSFPSPEIPKQARLKRLTEGLGENVIAMKDLKNLSPAIARDYARLSAMAISRDVAELKEMDLIEVDDENKTIRAKREKVLALLPDRKINKNSEQPAEQNSQSKATSKPSSNRKRKER